MSQISRPWQGSTALGALGDAGSYTAAQWAETWKTMIGVGASYANRGVMRGVENELEVTPNSPAAKSVLVESGSALVAGRWYYSSGSEALVIADNASGSTRNDIIILEADYTAQTVRLAVLQGTPAAGLPSLTQDITSIYQIPLAYLTLASGFATVTASMITDYREYANLPDAVGYLATNASGGALENGAVVTPTGTQSFTTASSVSGLVAGILERRTANGAVGRIITHGIFAVLCEASVSVGDYLGISSTTGQAEVASAFSFARVLVANTGAGTRALCYINVPATRKPPACRVYHNANQTLGAGTVLAFNSERYDNNAMHDTVTNNSRITFNVPGVYEIGFHSVCTAAGDTLYIRVNGLTDIAYDNPGTQIKMFTTYNFSAGDYIEIYKTGGANTFNYTANYSTEFYATWVSGV